MLSESVIFDSDVAGYGQVAAWIAQPLDLWNPGYKTVSFHILWEDVAATFYLYQSNYNQFTAYEDFTVEYRLIDPLWVDPALGDPAGSNHIVSFRNTEAKYVTIGFNGGTWTGGATRRLRVNFAIERYLP